MISYVENGYALECTLLLVSYIPKTPDHEGSTYVGLLSRDTVRFFLIYSVLMGLNIMAVDIHNFYLTDPTYEKFYIIYGPEL